MDPRGLFVIAGGLFSICGALFDWDWFMNHYRARFFNHIWGRQGTRIFYCVLGGLMVALGGAIASGAMD